MHWRQVPRMSAQWVLRVCRYDLFGSNFQVPLRMALTSLSMDDEDMPEGTLIPDSELPELPESSVASGPTSSGKLLGPK